MDYRCKHFKRSLNQRIKLLAKEKKNHIIYRLLCFLRDPIVEHFFAIPSTGKQLIVLYKYFGKFKHKVCKNRKHCGKRDPVYPKVLQVSLARIFVLTVHVLPTFIVTMIGFLAKDLLSIVEHSFSECYSVCLVLASLLYRLSAGEDTE